MKEEAINPGYSNQIFIWGNPMTHGNHSEIVGGNKTQFLKFDYQKSLQKDFILVKTTSLFIEKSDNGQTEIPIITDVTSYRLVKDHDFTAEELYPIIQTSTKRLVQYFQENDKIQSGNRQSPSCPELHDVQTQLEALAANLNQSI